MPLGKGVFGKGVLGARIRAGSSSINATAPGASLAGSSSIQAGSASAYDYRITVIGDSNASSRGTNLQTYTNAGGIQTDLFNNAGSVVPLADPWDGGQNTYAALDDGASALGSYIPRLAQRLINSGKKTLWIPANKGGTQAADWAYSTNTATCYGAMKARIDAAGGTDIIIIHLGANDAMAGVSQATFKTRIEALVGHLLTDYPTAKVYLQKIHHFSGYTAQIDSIRAGVDDVWSGSSGCRVGADLDGITTNVHYTTDSDLDAVAAATYGAIFTVSATATGATLSGTSSLTAGAATGEVNASAPGATLTGTSSISAGAASGQDNASAPAGTVTGPGTIQAGQPVDNKNATAPSANVTGQGTINASQATGGNNNVDATAPTANVTGPGTIQAGQPVDNQNATAPAANVTGTGTINAAPALGDRDASAPAATVTGPGTITAGQATGIQPVTVQPVIRAGIKPRRLVVGTNIRLDITVEDEKNQRLDIQTTDLTVRIRKPRQQPATLQAIRRGPGAFDTEINFDKPGRWYWRIETTAPENAVAEGTFTVKPSRFRV